MIDLCTPAELFSGAISHLMIKLGTPSVPAAEVIQHHGGGAVGRRLRAARQSEAPSEGILP